MKRNTTRVAVLHHPPTFRPDGPEDDQKRGRARRVRDVAGVLKGAGFKAWTMAARAPVARLVRSLARQKPHVVVNMARDYAGIRGGEAYVAGLLELAGVPAVGGPPEALALCRDGHRLGAVLRGMGLPAAPDEPGGVALRVGVIARPEPSALAVPGDDPDLSDRLNRLAVAAFRAAGCRDAALVDFRLDAEGAPVIAGVDPNPDLSPSGDLAASLRASDHDHSATLSDLIRQALGRAPDGPAG